MTSEFILFAIVFCVAIFPLMANAMRVRIERPVVLASLIGLWIAFPIALICFAVMYSEPVTTTPVATYRPIAEETDDYVGSDTCQTCHARQHASWQESYHRTMTQVASRESVVAPFESVDLEKDGHQFHLREAGDQFLVDIESPDDAALGKIAVRAEIVMTTGSHHYQVYWFKLGDDTRALGMFPFVYLIHEKRWIPRQSSFLSPPLEGIINEMGRWNDTCIRCHATHGRMLATESINDSEFDLLSLDTRVAEFGIACEACHGPGRRHVDANRDPLRRYDLHFADRADETIVQPARLDHRRSAAVCGNCHSVNHFVDVRAWREWNDRGIDFRPGDEIGKSTMRRIINFHGTQEHVNTDGSLIGGVDIRENTFWKDGMIRVSGREFNGLLLTPCYQRGEMSCLSCHQLHQQAGDTRSTSEWANDQLRNGFETNLACTQCHEKFNDRDVLQVHTHHQPDSSGSNCYNCHMPYTTYGLLKAIRSHQIDSPNLAVTLETGRPNACNQCHLDKTLQWTSEWLSKWYDHKPPDLPQDEQRVAASILWLLRGDAGQRAIMAWSFGWPEAQSVSGSDWIAPHLAQLLQDPYDAVRFIAARSLRGLKGFDSLNDDFLDAPHERRRASKQALELWLLAKPNWNDSMRARELLIDDRGQLIQSDFDRLLKQRDDREIYLSE